MPAIYEFRSYHYAPEHFPVYRRWAQEHAVPFFQREFDLVGFWTSLDMEPEVLDEPLDHLGAANVNWVLRWQDMAQRQSRMAAVFQGPEWEEVFARLPGGFEHYLRREARFMEKLESAT